ncbi:hypothetical protein [Natronosalvus caseinilyticus]|uniref:hypothetical protein n=1 Tax=Natronosalvus caseinilyticus TaxID=2953747 RepID=UPI0028ADC7E3|nr:hypothetical protein [Natronosalvus caseinilyticus]
MNTHIRRQFSVSDVADDHVWLKLLEGEKKGLEFAAYADAETLNDLNEGETVTVTMKSRNPRDTEWEVADVENSNQSGRLAQSPA